MLGVTAFDLTRDDVNLNEIIRENNHFNEERRVNDYNETLDTWIQTNEITTSGYRNYRIITDEVVDYRVRVKGEVVLSSCTSPVSSFM
jgi:hypothetical protein